MASSNDLDLIINNGMQPFLKAHFQKALYWHLAMSIKLPKNLEL